MMTREKQLETRIALLERMMMDMLSRTGMDIAEVREYERAKAIEHMRQTGDPSAIKAHLTKLNGG
jgi:hypothetical protein